MGQDFIGLPNDGAGKKLNTQSHADGKHNQIMTLGDPIIQTNLQYVDEYGAAYTRGSEGHTIFDSFGKTKMSQETIIGEYMPSYDTLPTKVQTSITGTASEIYVPNERSIRLQTDVAIGDRVVRTTNKYHKYYPGTSQYIMMTVVIGDQGKSGVTRAWGYYDDDNGLFFEMKDDVYSVVIRSNTSGVVQETRIAQTDFNGDKGDGTGLSGVTTDPSKASIFWIDFQWLGVGRIRFGSIAPNGVRLTHHTVENANKNSAVYMGTASLPVRWEQFNTAATGSVSEMKVVNAVVFTDSDNLETRGICQSSSDILGTPVPTTTKATGDWDCLVSIRPTPILDTKKNRSVIIPQHIFISTDKPVQYSIMPDVNNGGTETWLPCRDTSIADKATGLLNVDIGPGTPVFCGMMDAGIQTVDLIQSFDYLRENLHNYADGSPRTFSLMVRTLDGTSATVSGGITWTELII